MSMRGGPERRSEHGRRAPRTLTHPDVISRAITMPAGGGNLEAAPGGGKAPLRGGKSRWREEVRHRDGAFSCRWPASRRPGGRFRSVETSATVARLGEVTASVHLAKEEELVDLAEGPMRLAEADSGEPGRQIGG